MPACLAVLVAPLTGQVALVYVVYLHPKYRGHVISSGRDFCFNIEGAPYSVSLMKYRDVISR